jgi:hypothetical protein
MPINVISKILFPSDPHWQRRRKVKTIIWVVATAVSFGCLVGALMWLAAAKK